VLYSERITKRADAQALGRAFRDVTWKENQYFSRLLMSREYNDTRKAIWGSGGGDGVWSGGLSNRCNTEQGMKRKERDLFPALTLAASYRFQSFPFPCKLNIIFLKSRPVCHPSMGDYYNFYSSERGSFFFFISFNKHGKRWWFSWRHFIILILWIPLPAVHC